MAGLCGLAPIFLSTLSLRRATPALPRRRREPGHFYPRSPCGERRRTSRRRLKPRDISIHALLAESDERIPQGAVLEQNFYPRSPCGERPFKSFNPPAMARFLSTLSLRRATQCVVRSYCYNDHFYPRSPCGERHLPQQNCAAGAKFLSTLSLRRATNSFSTSFLGSPYFYPRSPCGERPAKRTLVLQEGFISIHALLAESDPDTRAFSCKGGEFLSTLSLRRATAPISIAPGAATFLSTLSLRRATGIRGQRK